MGGTLAAVWGVFGVSCLLISAIFRLSVYAGDALQPPLARHHWLALIVSVALMAYSEGYRAFQKGFSPRVAARARYLKQNPTLLRGILAPLFCMGFFYTTRRRQITSISVTAGIILLVILVRLMPQPWRGIVDASVVVGLTWGAVSLLIFSVRALTSDHFPYSPEVPE